MACLTFLALLARRGRPEGPSRRRPWRVTITFEAGHPPSGTVSVRGGAPHHLETWIALLGILGWPNNPRRQCGWGIGRTTSTATADRPLEDPPAGRCLAVATVICSSRRAPVDEAPRLSVGQGDPDVAERRGTAARAAAPGLGGACRAGRVRSTRPGRAGTVAADRSREDLTAARARALTEQYARKRPDAGDPQSRHRELRLTRREAAPRRCGSERPSLSTRRWAAACPTASTLQRRQRVHSGFLQCRPSSCGSASTSSSGCPTCGAGRSP